MNEKEIFKRLEEFEASFEEKESLKESKNKLLKTEFYEEFTINEIDFRNLFITTEEDEKGNISRNIYCRGKESILEIITIDADGNVHILNPELAKNLGEVELEKVIDENLEKIKGTSESIDAEEMENKLKEEDEKKEENEKVDENKKPKEQDLAEENDKDLEITYYRSIEDDNFGKQLNKDFSEYKEIGFAYSKTEKAYVLVGLKEGESNQENIAGQKSGKFERIEGFEPAKTTFKTVMSIDEKGEKVEKKVPNLLMKTDDPKKELSMTIDTGYKDVGVVERLPFNDMRIERQIAQDGEGKISGKEDPRMTRTIKVEGQYAMRDFATNNKDTFDNMEIGDKDSDNVKDEIHKDIDEDALIRDAAQNRAKVSEEEFRNILETIPDDKPLEYRIEEAIEKVEEQYRQKN